MEQGTDSHHGDFSQQDEKVESLIQEINQWKSIGRNCVERPWVTLSYAQSVDGNIAVPGRRTHLSCLQSTIFTHQLRACHEYILVGIGTVITDNPQLTVRYGVNNKSQHCPQEAEISTTPIPVILDSSLKIPMESSLILRDHTVSRPLLFTSEAAYESEKRKEIEKHGIQVFSCPLSTTSHGLCLEYIFRQLKWHYHLGDDNHQKSCPSVLVEGGAQIIRSLVLQPSLIDLLVLTWRQATLVGNDMILVGVFNHMRNQ
ncbi:2,5-diamino-6-ribosylamino-4(3H)-pyrimidinone 5'-phosphate reductase [Galdieria sulphuraria]|nr:2,5-diamino-6-ribosylamino-4(3H)-pyrimidinone 5'-phosphate reductase [Galdieria sulphuraria]